MKHGPVPIGISFRSLLLEFNDPPGTRPEKRRYLPVSKLKGTVFVDCSIVHLSERYYHHFIYFRLDAKRTYASKPPNKFYARSGVRIFTVCPACQQDM